MNLVLGATGYVGSHLAPALPAAETILHCRSERSLAQIPPGYKFVVEDLALTRKGVAALNPATVYLLARPLPIAPDALLDFAENVQWLLQEWVERGCLKRIVFFSSQLVYATPTSREPLTIASPTGPQSPYDFHKLEMESFLGVLAHYDALRSVEILRLPLVAGRPCTPAQSELQFLFKWQAAYRNGLRWKFPGNDPRENEWGNSWVHIDDLAALLVRDPLVSAVDAHAVKYRIVQPVSGDFTYRELHEYFLAHGAGAVASRGELTLPRTSFFLRDNAGVRPRQLAEAFGAAT